MLRFLHCLMHHSMIYIVTPHCSKLTGQAPQVGLDPCAGLIDLSEPDVASDPPSLDPHYPNVGTWLVKVGVYSEEEELMPGGRTGAEPLLI